MPRSLPDILKALVAGEAISQAEQLTIDRAAISDSRFSDLIGSLRQFRKSLAAGKSSRADERRAIDRATASGGRFLDLVRQFQIIRDLPTSTRRPIPSKARLNPSRYRKRLILAATAQMPFPFDDRETFLDFRAHMEQLLDQEKNPDRLRALCRFIMDMMLLHLDDFPPAHDQTSRGGQQAGKRARARSESLLADITARKQANPELSDEAAARAWIRKTSDDWRQLSDQDQARLTRNLVRRIERARSHQKRSRKK